MTEIDVKQGSKEWLRLKLGKVTGTRLKDVLKTDNLPLIDLLISEIESEEIEETYKSKKMERGNDLEALARIVYTEVTGIEIQEVGFCLSDKYDFLALSPDGFTYDRKGGIEIKCPDTKTHVKYIRQNKVPTEYFPQVLNYFLVNNNLDWVDFISFDDRFKVKPLFRIRVKREEISDEIKNAEEALNKFWVKFLKYYKQVIN